MVRCTCRVGGLLLAALAIVLAASCASKETGGGESASPFAALSGPYFGQPPPGMTPEMFARGAVSTGMQELNAVFFPGAREFCYSIDGGAMRFVLLLTREEDGCWTEPEVTLFTQEYTGVDAWATKDGNRLYFCSDRPRPGEERRSDWDIWYVDRMPTGWSEPVNVGPPVNSEADEFYPSLADDGTMYFQSSRVGGMGGRELWRSEWVDGRYTEPENLGPPINSAGFEGDPCIAGDESFIIFSAANRDDTIGMGDLYICFRTDDGGWSEAVHMGEEINSRAHENCPIFSPDGRYFFFTSRKTPDESPETRITYESLKNRLTCPENGQGDIYWVDARVIDQFRPESLD